MKYNVIKIGAIAILMFVMSSCAVNTPQKITEEVEVNTTSQGDASTQEEASTQEDITTQEVITTQGDVSTQGEEIDQEAPQVKSERIQNLENLILNDADSVLVAAYVRNNIKEASPEEADQMIEILLQMQTALIQRSHEGILYEPAYMDALNITMGGVLAPDKISKIENEKVRSFYQSVADSDLTMVRYEETPVLETDWVKIKGYQATFTEPFQMVVDFHDDKNLFREENVEALVNRIYAMEEMLLKAPNGFAKDELTELYSTYVSRMLIGPEGTYLYRLVNASDSYYKKMTVAIEGHETSGFAKIAKEMMAETLNTDNHLMDIVGAYRLNNPYIEHRFEKNVASEGDIQIVTLTYEGVDASITKRVNELIQSATKALVESSGATSDYQIDMYKSYQFGDYATIQIYNNYLTEDGESHYDEKSVNLDLKNGVLLTLNTLLNSEAETVLDKINTVSDSNFTRVPDFSLTVTGLLLTDSKGSSPNAKYSVITKDQLLKIRLK
ncbi:hypothetical protein [Fusibacter ferrireducens]|uniref:Uncharacterized protein n=1 Tax=Fusibacter ferrireducens TaxID=2785058 RepID=A0ABR9ZZZ1_9FIRM|nr:hypothetical protein [Fusibacter ferrireducens]MBF4695551.1 hypothetical protein [Fusibacter ferrireducens]